LLRREKTKKSFWGSESGLRKMALKNMHLEVSEVLLYATVTYYQLISKGCLAHDGPERAIQKLTEKSLSTFIKHNV